MLIIDVTVEGELGVLAGVEDEVSAEHHIIPILKKLSISLLVQVVTLWLFLSVLLTVHTSSNPNSAKRSGYRSPGSSSFGICRIDAVNGKLPGFPIVLHGSSSVPQEEVDTINKLWR